jgi:hypothetical protein
MLEEMQQGMGEPNYNIPKSERACLIHERTDLEMMFSYWRGCIEKALMIPIEASLDNREPNYNIPKSEEGD